MDRATLEIQLRQIIASAEAALSELEKEGDPPPKTSPSAPEAPLAPPPPPEPEPTPGPPASENQGARLVALKMALDGSSREDVGKHLADEYGLGDSAALLDDVFERAGL